MPDGFPDFRLGNVLATSFTGTLSERHGDAVERIPTPQRLVDWFAVSGLAVDSCTTAISRAAARRQRQKRTMPSARKSAAKPSAPALVQLALSSAKLIPAPPRFRRKKRRASVAQ